MKRVRLIALPLLAVLMGIALLLPLSAGGASSQTAASQASTTCSNTATCPITGTVTNRAGHVYGTFTGTLTITQFAAQNGQLVAQGTLSGTVTNAEGEVLKTITNRSVTMPVQSFTVDPTCTVLTLTLGPLDLNLLGLMIHLNQVVLTITAQTGTLLGNLLCSLVTTPPPTLAQIIALLNEILALLGGL
jgi:hypothetical protein